MKQRTKPMGDDYKALFVTLMINCFKKGNKVLICGNGGSASQSVHFAAELVGKFLHIRRPLPAISLAANISTLTAIGNDFGFVLDKLLHVLS